MENKGRVLLTGGTGFLGGYLLKRLVEGGYAVRALRRREAVPFGIPETVLQRVEWVRGDILDIVALQEAAEGCIALIHSAALVSFSRTDRALMQQTNAEGTANAVNAALETGVERFIHISSVAALGRKGTDELLTEEAKWEGSKGQTGYAVSKREAELHVWRGFAEGLGGVILNPSTILGFGNWHHSSCALFRNGYRGFPWYSGGVNGFVGVEDVADAAVRLLEAPVDHRRFIINAENLPFRTVLDAIAEGFGTARPHRKATPFLGELVWRLESVRSLLSGRKALLTRESARVAHSRTTFNNAALPEVLPGFSYQPVSAVIATACAQYAEAIRSGQLTL